MGGVLLAGLLVGGSAANADAAVYSVSATFTGAGDTPDGIATDAARGRSYLASAADDSVVVLNDVTGAVIATIPVGDDPHAVAIDSSTHTVWVTNYFGGSVSVIDEDTNAVTATVFFRTVGNGPNPGAIAIDAQTHRAYLSNGNHTTTVINTHNHRVVATWGIGFGGIAVDPTRNLVLVADANADVVYFVNGATGAIEQTVGVGSYSIDVAIDPGAGRAYVANYESDSVSVLDLASQSDVATIPTADSAAGVAVDPTTGVLYVTAEGDANNLSVYDESSLAALATLPVGSGPIAVSVDKDTHQAFVVNEFDNSVSVVDRTLERTPVLTTITPDSGTAGTKVTITGSGFTATTTVRFGHATATTVNVRSSHRIVATAPAHAAGIVNVRVQTAGGTSAVSRADQFHYCGS